jgi:hypothetical protein
MYTYIPFIVVLLAGAAAMYLVAAGWIKTDTGLNSKRKKSQTGAETTPGERMIADGRRESRAGIRLIVGGIVLVLAALLIVMLLESATDLTSEVLP